MKNVILALLSVFAMAIGANYVLAAEDGLETRQTRVVLTSQPSGAQVIVDCKDRGTTPITLFDIAPGRHRVKFRLAGYVEHDRFIDTRESLVVERNVVLQEEKGLLLIKTEPSDCDVRIDGASIGRSPLLVTSLAVKDAHSIQLVKAGYLPQTISVKFDGRKPIVRDEKLTIASGMIHVTSEPAGAEITVNGLPCGKTPQLIRDVANGKAAVRLRLDGYQDENRELVVTAGDQQELPVTMKALPGTLHLVSIPNGARFYINNEPRGVSPLIIPGLSPGEYTVRAEKDGFGTMDRKVQIVNGQSAREEFKLSNVMGRLEVRTDPPGASVFVDGHLVGVTSVKGENQGISDALAVNNLLEGEHLLLVRKDGYADSIRHPKIENSKTSSAKVRLKRVFVPDVEIVTEHAVYRGILVSNDANAVVVEIQLGINRTFMRSEIRKINFLGSNK